MPGDSWVPSDDLDSIYQGASRAWNVDPKLLRALAMTESSGNPAAVSKAGAKGLTGLMPDTASGLGVTDINDPAQQIYAGAKYLSEALTNEKSPEDALRYYHGGPNWRAAYGKESAAYAPTVTKHYVALNQPASAPQPAAADPFTAAQTVPAQAGPDAFGSAQTASPAPTDADPFTAAQAGAPEAPQVAAAPPTATPAAEPTAMQKIGAGLTRAAHDLTDVPAEYLAKGADAIGLTGLMNRAGITTPTAPQTAAANNASLQEYNQQYGDSSLATTARVGGQIAGVIPVLASGGGVVGGAGDIAAATAGRVAPWLGRAVEGARSLLSGTASTTGGVLNPIVRGASLAANGALQGGAAGALTAGQSDQSLGSQIASGAELGAIAGPVAGILGTGARAVGNALTGYSANAAPEVAQLAKLARDTYGIPINGPQLSGNSLVRIANDQSTKLPFSGAAGAVEAQQQAWQKAVANTFGENATHITPDVMNSAARRIGGVFNDVARRTNVTFDAPVLSDLGRIEQEAAAAPLGSGGTQAIHAQIDNIMDAAARGNGTITGKDYQQLIRAGSPLQRAQQAADPNVRYYANQVRDALDGAFQRSAAPEDQAALKQARGQYRNMKTIEDLVEKSPDGNLSPALLMGQVRSASSRFDPSTGGMAYTGGGPLGDLARIGQQFLKPQANSGTADRILINSLLGGGGAAATMANPFAAAAVPAGLVANRLGGAYLRSGGYANRVINSSLNPNTNPLTKRLIPLAAPVGALTSKDLTHP